VNALDLIALTFCPVGHGFWSASDKANSKGATNRALGAYNGVHAMNEGDERHA
jgi:hypothetical protein